MSGDAAVHTATPHHHPRPSLIKSALPPHLQHALGGEGGTGSPALSTPGSAKSGYAHASGGSESVLSTVSGLEGAYDTSDESLGIRRRKERRHPSSYTVPDVADGVEPRREEGEDEADTSKSSHVYSSNASCSEDTSASSASLSLSTSASASSPAVAAPSSKLIHAPSSPEVRVKLPSASLPISSPSPSMRSFIMSEYRNEPHPASPLGSPLIEHTNPFSHLGASLASPKLEAIQEITEEITALDIQTTPAYLQPALGRGLARSERKASSLRLVQESLEEEDEASTGREGEEDDPDVSTASSLLSILSPLAHKSAPSSSSSSSASPGEASTSTPSHNSRSAGLPFITHKPSFDLRLAPKRVLTVMNPDEALDSPVTVSTTSAHRGISPDLPPLPAPSSTSLDKGAASPFSAEDSGKDAFVEATRPSHSAEEHVRTESCEAEDDEVEEEDGSGEQSESISFGMSRIKDILWHVPNFEMHDFRLCTPEDEQLPPDSPFSGPPTPHAEATAFEDAAVVGGERIQQNIREAEKEKAPVRERDVVLQPVPAKKVRSRTVTYTAENLPSTERHIPVLMGPNALPYARCPSGIDSFAFNLDDPLPYDPVYPVPGPVHQGSGGTYEAHASYVAFQAPAVTTTAPTPHTGARTYRSFAGPPPSMQTAASTHARGGSTGSVSSTGTAVSPPAIASVGITANARARQRSEQAQLQVKKRDQRRIEEEGRREVARIVRDIQRDERGRLRAASSDSAAANIEQDGQGGGGAEASMSEEQMNWVYDSDRGGWIRCDEFDVTPRLSPREEYFIDHTGPIAQLHAQSVQSTMQAYRAGQQGGAPRSSTAYARERALASHPIQTLMAAHHVRSRQTSPIPSPTLPSHSAFQRSPVHGHAPVAQQAPPASKSKLSSAAAPFTYHGPTPAQVRKQSMNHHPQETREQDHARVPHDAPLPSQEYLARKEEQANQQIPTHATHYAPAAPDEEATVRHNLNHLSSAFQGNPAAQWDALKTLLAAQTQPLQTSMPPQMLQAQAQLRMTAVDPAVIAAMQQAQMQLAQMLAQTQQQMHQLQLMQGIHVHGQLQQHMPAVPPQYDPFQAAAGLPGRDSPHVQLQRTSYVQGAAAQAGAPDFKSAQAHYEPAKMPAMASESGKKKTAAALQATYPPGLPFPIYVRPAQPRRSLGPEDDPAIIASFRRTSVAMTQPNPSSPASNALGKALPNSVEAAARRVEDLIAEARSHSGNALPIRPAPPTISPHLLGIIPCDPPASGSPAKAKNPKETPVTKIKAVSDAISTQSAKVEARRRVRSNAPSPQVVETPTRFTPSSTSFVESPAITRSAPVRTPLAKWRPETQASTADPKSRVLSEVSGNVDAKTGTPTKGAGRGRPSRVKSGQREMSKGRKEAGETKGREPSKSKSGERMPLIEQAGAGAPIRTPTNARRV